MGRSRSRVGKLHSSVTDLWTNAKERGVTLAELTETIGNVGTSQVRRALLRKSGTTRAVREGIAKAFGVTEESIAGEHSVEEEFRGWAFNLRKGLRQDVPSRSGPDKAPFQDFIESKDNRAFIDYLWAEMRGDWIRLSSKSGDERDLSDILVVNYFNSGEASPPNVSIHPQGQVARRRLEQEWLCLQARYTQKKSANKSPVFGVRVGDGLHYQWEYTPSDQRRYSRLGKDFATFYFHLANMSLWSVMYTAPSETKSHPAYIPKQPDFNWLTTIVFDFGFGGDLNIKARGTATVEIKNICLCSSDDFVPRLKSREKRSQFKLTAATS